MATFDVAHIREQGVDLIIIPLKSSFGQKGQMEQSQITASLQAAAQSAGLAGTVVPVWETVGGRMGFLAPNNYHPFFKNIDMNFVATNVNRKLTVF